MLYQVLCLLIFKTSCTKLLVIVRDARINSYLTTNKLSIGLAEYFAANSARGVHAVFVFLQLIPSTQYLIQTQVYDVKTQNIRICPFCQRQKIS